MEELKLISLIGFRFFGDTNADTGPPCDDSVLLSRDPSLREVVCHCPDLENVYFSIFQASSWREFILTLFHWGPSLTISQPTNSEVHETTSTALGIVGLVMYNSRCTPPPHKLYQFMRGNPQLTAPNIGIETLRFDLEGILDKFGWIITR